MNDENAMAMPQKVGEVTKPMVPEGTVEELLERVYGLKVVKVKSLNSYDDCNYAITVDENYDNKYIKQLWPHGYLLKIVNTMDSKRPKMHEALNLVMDYVRKRDVPTQEPIPGKNGEVISYQKIYNKKGHHVDFDPVSSSVYFSPLYIKVVSDCKP
ncbi:hydroxylysine kinase [Patella vulgata]|uniref:hydroxylysine kinase n=1 Tax=Patella vulgata TaxID=6465 RepID=UPI0021802ADF|nr:hydroxylysine kinase [Patella vulgata]